MKEVFLLHHEYEWCGHDKVTLIGVYASHNDAQEAIERLRDQPGFRDWPQGFSIDSYEIGVDHWVEGFITVVHILIPSRTNTNSYQVAGSIWRPGDIYEVTDISDPEDAMFVVGDLVRCKEANIPNHGDRVLVALEVCLDGT